MGFRYMGKQVKSLWEMTAAESLKEIGEIDQEKDNLNKIHQQRIDDLERRKTNLLFRIVQLAKDAGVE